MAHKSCKPSKLSNSNFISREGMYSWLRRNLSALPKSSNNNSTRPTKQGRSVAVYYEEEEELYGVTDHLVEFVKGFTIDTFKNSSLAVEDQSDETPGTTGGLQVDLSDWQQRHAVLVLSKVKELSQLRYKLCPRHLKEREFWRVYFTMVKSLVAVYELRAIRLDRLRKMAMEDEKCSETKAVELEMSETKQVSGLLPP